MTTPCTATFMQNPTAGGWQMVNGFNEMPHACKVAKDKKGNSYWQCSAFVDPQTQKAELGLWAVMTKNSPAMTKYCMSPDFGYTQDCFDTEAECVAFNPFKK